MEPEAGIADHRRGQGERHPLPAGELKRRQHRQQHDRDRQGSRDGKPAREHLQWLVVMVMSAAVVMLVRRVTRLRRVLEIEAERRIVGHARQRPLLLRTRLWGSSVFDYTHEGYIDSRSGATSAPGHIRGPRQLLNARLENADPPRARLTG